jgi:hypothetical protein
MTPEHFCEIRKSPGPVAGWARAWLGYANASHVAAFEGTGKAARPNPGPPYNAALADAGMPLEPISMPRPIGLQT